MQKNTLYIVATPIGNLEDITHRAVRILSEVDLIVCENKKVSSKLLKHLNISKKLVNYNAFNENTNVDIIINLIKEHNSVALISDAGTPLISDPGFHLVQACISNNIEVITIPGASSVISALSVSALPLNKFVFLGFLDKTSNKRQQALKEFIDSDITIVFFESPHRILNTLKDIAQVFAHNQTVVLARELTKLYEEVKRDTVENLIEFYNSNKAKGEFVVLLKPTAKILHHTEEDIHKYIAIHIDTQKPKDLAKTIALKFNITTKASYDIITAFKNNSPI
jgi:16S rRNA (cytidine1402-2'-O)-methyltransferase